MIGHLTLSCATPAGTRNAVMQINRVQADRDLVFTLSFLFLLAVVAFAFAAGFVVPAGSEVK
jgi:hypothetical protein